MQKLCCVRTRQHSLPVWIILSQVHHRISTNSQPFLVGIVSLILLNLISTFLHHPMKRKVNGFVLLTTKVTVSPGGSSLRILTRLSFVLSVTGTRRTLRMPRFTRATHAQPSLSNFPRQDSDFGERTRSRGTTRLERNFPTSPQNKKTKLTHRSIYVPMRTISTPQIK